MKKPKTQTVLRFFIAAVWLASGLFCKVLNLVPRHHRIVARILGNEHAGILTVSIGGLEALMAVWILSRYQPKLNAIVQMAVIATMNILEFILAPDLLLWGRLNIVFAFLFISLIYFYEFHLSQKQKTPD